MIHAFEMPIISVSNVFSCIVEVLGNGVRVPFSQPTNVNRPQVVRHICACIDRVKNNERRDDV